jgi:hypothetical protein
MKKKVSVLPPIPEPKEMFLHGWRVKVSYKPVDTKRAGQIREMFGKIICRSIERKRIVLDIVHIIRRHHGIKGDCHDF